MVLKGELLQCVRSLINQVFDRKALMEQEIGEKIDGYGQQYQSSDPSRLFSKPFIEYEPKNGIGNRKPEQYIRNP